MPQQGKYGYFVQVGLKAGKKLPGSDVQTWRFSRNGDPSLAKVLPHWTPVVDFTWVERSPNQLLTLETSGLVTLWDVARVRVEFKMTPSSAD